MVLVIELPSSQTVIPDLIRDLIEMRKKAANFVGFTAIDYGMKLLERCHPRTRTS